MSRPALPALAAVLCALTSLVAASPARGDVITLTDGTRVQGNLERTADGYTVIAPDGKATRVKTSQIKSVEVKPQATPDDAKRRLHVLRRAAENMTDARQAIARYNDFVRNPGNNSVAAEARQDLAEWQHRLDRQMTKVAGKWVTPEELGSLKRQAHETAAKARDLVAQGRLREAGPLLQQALDVDPKNASALYLRGVVLFRQEQLGPARKAFEQTAQLVPNHGPSLNNVAVIYWKQKNEAAAIRSYDAALAATGPAGSASVPVADAVLNNVAEALHSLPRDQRDAPAAKKLVQHFQEREEAMEKAMKPRGLYRWGANWVEADQLDKLIAKEKEIEKTIAALEAEFDTVQQRMDEIDQDIADTERALRRMESTAYVRDPVTGRIGRTSPPRMYYGLQRDLADLQRERAGQDAKIAEFRQKAKQAKQELPVQRYTGVQRLIDAEGTPLVAAPATRPASAPAADGAL